MSMDLATPLFPHVVLPGHSSAGVSLPSAVASSFLLQSQAQRTNLNAANASTSVTTSVASFLLEPANSSALFAAGVSTSTLTRPRRPPTPRPPPTEISPLDLSEERVLPGDEDEDEQEEDEQDARGLIDLDADVDVDPDHGQQWDLAGYDPHVWDVAGSHPTPTGEDAAENLLLGADEVVEP
ncbi:hypothetical protein C8R43DRAFT_502519 [Mycena crocata]|nr:hypothetical protein C8R43DRAFT_502519 [Mycena crocata]